MTIRTPEESERRVRRGCAVMVLLLVIITIFNGLGTGLSVLTIASGAALVLAVVGLVLVNWPGRP